MWCDDWQIRGTKFKQENKSKTICILPSEWGRGLDIETAPWKSSYPSNCCPQFVPMASGIPQSCTELGIGFSWFESTHRQRQKPTETLQGWGLSFIACQSLIEETLLTIILWRVSERYQWWQFQVTKSSSHIIIPHNTADLNPKIHEWNKSPQATCVEYRVSWVKLNVSNTGCEWSHGLYLSL